MFFLFSSRHIQKKKKYYWKNKQRTKRNRCNINMIESMGNSVFNKIEVRESHRSFEDEWKWMNP